MVLKTSCLGTKMKDYKVFQYVYNKTHEHEDLIEEKYVFVDSEDELPKYIINYFFSDFNFLYYPAKSYSVAIIYAYLIHKLFDEEFYTTLNDKNLFCGNDKFFIPYEDDKKIYDFVIQEIGLFDKSFCLNLNIEQVFKTVKFFEKEFGVAVIDNVLI